MQINESGHKAQFTWSEKSDDRYVRRHAKREEAMTDILLEFFKEKVKKLKLTKFVC